MPACLTSTERLDELDAPDARIKENGIQQQSSKPTKGQRAWKAWQVFWAFFGPLFSLTAFWFNVTPTVTIEPSVNIDPSKLYATQILITNRGHVPIYDLTFACGIGAGGGATVMNGMLTAPNIRPAARLGAGQAITRSCDVGSLDVQGNTRLWIYVSYTWPLVGWRDTRNVVFDVKKGTPGYFLVPDTLP